MPNYLLYDWHNSGCVYGAIAGLRLLAALHIKGFGFKEIAPWPVLPSKTGIQKVPNVSNWSCSRRIAPHESVKVRL